VDAALFGGCGESAERERRDHHPATAQLRGIQKMMKELWELIKATGNLGMAKARSLGNPCPPHEYDERWNFCLKCGEYR
jgi:hypothetical protein